jgi:hypothetical protein
LVGRIGLHIIAPDGSYYIFAFQLLSDPDPNKKYDEKYHTIHSLYVVEWRKNRELKLRSLSLKT